MLELTPSFASWRGVQQLCCTPSRCPNSMGSPVEWSRFRGSATRARGHPYGTPHAVKPGCCWSVSSFARALRRRTLAGGSLCQPHAVASLTAASACAVGCGCCSCRPRRDYIAGLNWGPLASAKRPSHRDRGGHGRETPNCRRWSRLASCLVVASQGCQGSQG